MVPTDKNTFLKMEILKGTAIWLWDQLKDRLIITLESLFIHSVWMKVKVKIFQSCPTLFDPIAHQAHMSMEFSRQEYWSVWPFPSLKEFSPLRDQVWVSCIPGGFFTIWATGEAP